MSDMSKTLGNLQCFAQTA